MPLLDHRAPVTVADSLPPRAYRFGLFELDCRSGELLRDGRLVRRLQDQPLKVLLALLERSGEVVTREELRSRVWPDDTFVDFDHGLNSIVNRLRELVGDSADNARFIQTLPRRGYRFLAPVTRVVEAGRPPQAAATAPPAPSPASLPEDRRQPAPVDAGMAAAVARSRASRVGPTLWWFAVGVLVVVVAAATWIARGVVSPPPRPASDGVRVAVLPIENLTGDTEQAVFVDGLHEELIFRLGLLQPQRLTVIARTSVMPYRQTPKTIADVARELSVDYVLEGSVRRAGTRFRVTAQLIRGEDQSHAWTETYDRVWSDLLAVQGDIAARVADALAVELLPAYRAQVERDARVSQAAYEEYLRGRYYWNQRTRAPAENLTRAESHFAKAVELQPGYARAYVGLADVYDSMIFSSARSADDTLPQARAAIQKALALEPNLASAQATSAYMAMHFTHDLDGAAASFDRAVALDPNDALTHLRYSQLLAIRRRFDEAEREAQIARRLDPLAFQVPEQLAWLAWLQGADTQALLLMKQSADLDANAARARTFSAYVMAGLGRCDESRSALDQLRRVSDALPLDSDTAYALGRCGQDKVAIDTVRRELTGSRRSFALASLFLGLDDRDATFAALSDAIAEHSAQVLWIGVDPTFRPLGADARFQALLERLHLR
jgi:TolB-like protein/DNA-binding winged helix-turn-helix (wHTH) protein/Tfp pilus assembly protein PilF